MHTYQEHPQVMFWISSGFTQILKYRKPQDRLGNTNKSGVKAKGARVQCLIENSKKHTCNMAMIIARRAYEPIPPEYTCIVSKTLQIKNRGTLLFEQNEQIFNIDKLKPHSGLSVVKILSRSNTMVVVEAILVLLPKRKHISTV